MLGAPLQIVYVHTAVTGSSGNSRYTDSCISFTRNPVHFIDCGGQRKVGTSFKFPAVVRPRHGHNSLCAEHRAAQGVAAVLPQVTSTTVQSRRATAEGAKWLILPIDYIDLSVHHHGRSARVRV